MMRERLWVKFRLRQSGHLFSMRLRSVVPSNEDHSSFHLVLKLNDNGTRQFPFLRRSILELFSCLVHWNDTGTMSKWHWNDVGMRLEWRIEIIMEWLRNDARMIMSLGSVNWSIYFHYSLPTVHSIFIHDHWTVVGHTFHKVTFSDRFLMATFLNSWKSDFASTTLFFFGVFLRIFQIFRALSNFPGFQSTF